MSRPPEIHIVNPLRDSGGGSELRSIELYRELTPHALVDLWTQAEPDAQLAALYPIRRIDVESGSFPRGGTLIFVGVYKPPGTWVAAAQPRRAIVIYNTRTPRELLSCMHQLFAQGLERVEVVFASELLRQETKLQGIVEPSLIDLARFAPRAAGVSHPARPFTVGRLSRDNLRKHHPEDMAFYQRLTAAGCRVRIMGGLYLADQCTATDGIELLPAKAMPAEQFLQTLDCFFYRTNPPWWESFGRVIFEAMASGLPVVCHRGGNGYVTYIDHGRTGFLFDTSDEAIEIIQRLQRDPALRQSIGRAARSAVEAIYSPAERAKIIEYYLM